MTYKEKCLLNLNDQFERRLSPLLPRCPMTFSFSTATQMIQFLKKPGEFQKIHLFEMMGSKKTGRIEINDAKNNKLEAKQRESES